jgi:hypothetical protein
MFVFTAIFPQVILDPATHIPHDTIMHNNFKDLGAYIVTQMGKNYLGNLLPEELRKQHLYAYSKDGLSSIIDDLEIASRSELLALTMGSVQVRPETVNRAKKRARRDPPAEQPAVEQVAAPS